MLSGVAGRSCLVHDVEKRVVVAVHEDAPHLLDVSRGVPLLPEFVPAPAPVRRELRLHCRLYRLTVGVGQHQDLAGLRLLGHDRHQAVALCEINLVYLRSFQGNSLTVNRESGGGNKESEPFKPFKRRVHGPHSLEAKLNCIVEKDPAVQVYIANVKARRRNNGYFSGHSRSHTLSACRDILQYLNREINEHAITDLIAKVKEQHKRDDFSFDDCLLIYSNLESLRVHRNWATYLKGIFKANRCRLDVSVDNHFHSRTAKISDGILREIYLAQSPEKQALMDWQAYAGERVSSICTKIALNQIELVSDKYAIIHIEAHQTKARYNHICIVPRPIAEEVLKIALTTGRQQPFPNKESLWREITTFALEKYGVRLVSHYLRKRFHSIAQKTAMPVNDWDYLMGDKMSAGHEADIYTLTDWSDLVEEYDRFLAPYLSLRQPLNPLDAVDYHMQDQSAVIQTITNLNRTIENQNKSIQQLTQTIRTLTEPNSSKFTSQTR